MATRRRGGARPRSLAAVVLAAGHGTRLRSALPKTLHQVCGKPVLWHVLRAAHGARPDRLLIVVGKGRGQVEEAAEGFGFPEIEFVHQERRLGTGHAVMVAEEAVGSVDDVLVLPGDEPLVTAKQIRDLVRTLRRGDAAAVVQTAIAADPRGFGRVIREGDELLRITEGSEATAEELAIAEVATAVYAFRREDLYKALQLTTRETSQGEYYLHHVLPILREKGERIVVRLVDNGGSVGANSRSELAQAAVVMRRRINESHMARAVTIVDPSSTHIDAGVRIEPDAVILPMTFLEGDTRVGREARVGPATRLVDTVVGRGAEVQFSVAREARIGPRVSVGPYAHLRPGAVLKEGAKAGSFVEIKKSAVGKGAKVPHLAYVGDATIGDEANIGAGTVTVNYDGYEKHRTIVGEKARIGSDTMLVAPVRVGKEAYTGAGSTITRNVPPGALAVERAEQTTVKGYAKRRAARAAAKRRGGRGKRGS